MQTEIITFRDYLNFVKKTDRLPNDDLSAVLHGLFGEVGGIMSAAKKLKREPKSFTGFNSAIVEELADTFWYLCCLAMRLNVDMEQILIEVTKASNSKPEIVLGAGKTGVSLSYVRSQSSDFDDELVKLGQLTGEILSSKYILVEPDKKIYSFLEVFFEIIAFLKIEFGSIVKQNLRKVSSRFIRPETSSLPTFDSKYEEFERLPEDFEIEFVKRTQTQQAMRWNGVFIGDPLTDSISNDDGYRFHDVFHFANAAILHWSPTFRALIKHKRKSNPDIDRAEDGGRAIVVEEGLAAWIFNIAKENKLFKESESLTFDMLKNIGRFVTGFEVEECPLILWEEAILNGYKVFREVHENEGGIVIGSRKHRTIEYRKS